MIDERINKTLSELESGLRSVESARKQVEKTVQAYDGLTSSTNQYVSSLKTVNTQIDNLINQVDVNYRKTSQTFEEEVRKIIDANSMSIEQMKETANSMSETFSSTINAFTQTFDKEIDKVVNANDMAIEQMKETANSISEAFFSTINTFNNKLNWLLIINGVTLVASIVIIAIFILQR